MKTSKKILSSLILASIASVTYASTDSADYSYVIGYQVGSGISRQSIDLNENQTLQGFSDGINNKTPRISEEQITANLEEAKKEIVQRQIDLPKENAKHSAEFMQQIAQMKNVIKASDGVYYQILKQGDGEKPDRTSTVTIDYKGTTPVITYENDKSTLNDVKEGKLIGAQFDANNDISFPLGNLIECWKDAIPKIPTGSTFVLYCAPNVAYGENAPVSIGPNQALSFEITLKSFK